MSLRNQPFSERAFATFVLAALGAFLAGGLAFSLREGRPGSSLQPPARPQLMAVLEGVMASNVSPAETQVFRTWVQGGATRETYGPVEAVVGNNCASCHGPGGQFPRITAYEDLRPLALGEASGLYAALGSRTLHLLLFPLTFLVAAFGYLRRSRGPRRIIMGACLLAVLFDAGQWWLRQGRPGAWATGTALVLLSGAYLALVAVVLKDLWAGPE